MACEHRSSLWAHAAGELGLAEREALEAHLAGCAECRAQSAALRATRDLLALACDAPVQVDWRRADEQVKTAAARKLARLDGRPAPWGWTVGFAAAAACLAIVFVQARGPGPAQPALALAGEAATAEPAEPAIVEVVEGARLVGAVGPLTEGAALAAGAQLATPNAGRALIKLPDGSRVRLAGASRLRLVRIGREEVRLQVEQGRVAVKATHVERKGFVVEAGGAWVRVVGTAFSVGLSETEIEVAVAEGKVRLELPDGRTRMVKAGERAVIGREAGALSASGLKESDREDFAELEVALPERIRPAVAARPVASAVRAQPPTPQAVAPAPAAPPSLPIGNAPAATAQPVPAPGGLAAVPIELQLFRRAEAARAAGTCASYQEMLANYLEEPGANEGREQARWLRARCFEDLLQTIEADAEYRRYLREFPDGQHADEARKAVAH